MTWIWGGAVDAINFHRSLMLLQDLNTCAWYMERLAKGCDVNVMSYDYTGYGSCNDGKFHFCGCWFGKVTMIILPEARERLESVSAMLLLWSTIHCAC